MLELTAAQTLIARITAIGLASAVLHLLPRQTPRKTLHRRQVGSQSLPRIRHKRHYGRLLLSPAESIISASYDPLDEPPGEYYDPLEDLPDW